MGNSRDTPVDKKSEDVVIIARVNKQTGLEEKLEVRYTDLLEPKDRSIQVSFDSKWPKELSYTNPIIGVWQNKQDISFNFILEDNQTT